MSSAERLDLQIRRLMTDGLLTTSLSLNFPEIYYFCIRFSIVFSHCRLKCKNMTTNSAIKALPFLLLFFAGINQVCAQTFFYLQQIIISPNPATAGEPVSVTLKGQASDPCSYLSGMEVFVSGSDIHVQMDWKNQGFEPPYPACPAVLVPWDTTFTAGSLAAGDGQIEFDGTNFFVQAPTSELYFTVLPTQPFSCDACSTVEAFFEQDALQLAARIMAEEPAYSNVVNIPANLTGPILDAIIAVYNAVDIPERNMVIECLNIHSFPRVNTNSMLVFADPSFSWVQVLAGGGFPSGNGQIDQLFNTYGLTASSHMVPNGVIFTISSTNDLNMTALAALFESVPGVTGTEQTAYDGDGPDITYQDFDAYSTLTFSFGWGDCPAGCVSRRNWRFRVNGDCSVEFLNEWGDPYTQGCVPFTPFSNVSLSIGEASANAGSIVSIPVKVEHFNGVRSLSLSIRLDDPTIGVIQGVSSIGIPDMDISDFTITGDEVSLDWQHSMPLPVSLADGQVLFAIDIQLNGLPGACSALTFEGETLLMDAALKVKRPCIAGGELCVSAMEFGLGQECVVAGSELKIPVIVNGFQDIASFQYAITWDPNLLIFDTISTFGLPDLDENNFGTTNASNGLLTCLWYDNQIQGITLPDDAVIFFIHFKTSTVLCGYEAFVEFTGSPVIVEVTQVINGDLVEIDPGFISGKVEVVCHLELPAPAVQPVSCFGSGDGSINLNIAGGKEPYTIQWDNGMGGATIQGLQPGAYSATITDAMGTSITTGPIQITEPAAIAIQLQITHATSENNGSVEVIVTGGTPPYGISWSGGQPDDLPPGNYSITVTDSNGCLATRDFVIEFVDQTGEIDGLQELSLFPNPAGDHLLIRFELDEVNTASMRIRNAAGQLIWEHNTVARTIDLAPDISTWEAGVYFLELRVAGGVAVRKFVKM
jgi:hypothetical protein